MNTKNQIGGEVMQIDILVASVAYWVIIGAFLLIISRRVSKISKKMEYIEKRLKKEKVN